uniref:RNase H type-1 domain-containing protein n=3 Tax=Gossypium TaxID=3633 RepID=A0A0D2TYK9_GOSRA|nr:hypothetical protein B456_009G323900 [Gossypium raimondii]
MRTILHENISSVFTSEAMACLQAIRLGINLRLLMVKIEGDTRSVIRKLLTEEENRSEIEAYIEDSKRLCTRICSFFFRFTHKESNRVAHTLATEGLKRGENTYLINGVPPCAAE